MVPATEQHDTKASHGAGNMSAKTVGPSAETRSPLDTDDGIRLLADSATDFAMIFTDPERKVIRWSAGAENVLGWSEGEIIGQSELDLIFTPEDRAAGVPQWEQDTALREGRAAGERWHVKKDGSRIWAMGVMTPLYDPVSGKLRGFGKVLRDMTEYKRLDQALREALSREQRITEYLQRPLRREIAEDAFPGLSVATLYEPALAEAEVGGDFFDVFSLTDRDNEQIVVLVIGDVEGKGLPAAALAGRVKDVTRAFLRESHSPGRTLARLNEYLYDSISSNSFENGEGSLLVALSIVVVYIGSGTAVFSSAGTESPALLKNDGTIEKIVFGGTMLGVQRGGTYTEGRRHLHSGDMILLLTDGLTEARLPPIDSPSSKGAKPEFLGQNALLEQAQRRRTEPSVHNIGRALLEYARAFGGSFRDDACLLLARKR